MTKDQRVYPTRTADRCSDCPPAGYPTEKTRCYGCPLANTYKDATGELVIPTATPSSKRMTDRELLRSCMEAMHIAHKQRGSRTDWSLMIEDIRRHLESSAHETSCESRYKAALEKISQQTNSSAEVSSLATTARRALEGSAEEPACKHSWLELRPQDGPGVECDKCGEKRPEKASGSGDST